MGKGILLICPVMKEKELYFHISERTADGTMRAVRRRGDLVETYVPYWNDRTREEERIRGVNHLADMLAYGREYIILCHSVIDAENTIAGTELQDEFPCIGMSEFHGYGFMNGHSQQVWELLYILSGKWHPYITQTEATVKVLCALRSSDLSTRAMWKRIEYLAGKRISALGKMTADEDPEVSDKRWIAADWIERMRKQLDKMPVKDTRTLTPERGWEVVAK